MIVPYRQMPGASRQPARIVTLASRLQLEENGLPAIRAADVRGFGVAGPDRSGFYLVRCWDGRHHLVLVFSCKTPRLAEEAAGAVSSELGLAMLGAATSLHRSPRAAAGRGDAAPKGAGWPRDVPTKPNGGRADHAMP